MSASSAHSWPTLSAPLWMLFTVRLMLGVVIVSAVITLLALVFGTLSTSKNQLIIPVRDTTDKTSQIEFIDVDRGNAYFLDISPLAVDSHLAWSPDSSQIAFAAAPDRDNEIYLMNSTGGQMRQLTRDHVDLYSIFAWSPDSRKIAYVAVEEHEIRLIDVQQGTVSPLVSQINNAQSPVWSPDGSQIAFLSMNDQGQTSLSSLHTDGKILQEMTAGFFLLGGMSPPWSPDGKYLTFSPLKDGAINIYTVDTGTGSLQQLTHSNFIKGSPIWSSDSRQIIFWEVGVNGFAVNRVNADGSGQTQLTYLSDATCTSLSWSSDNQYIAIGTIGLDTNRVYLMNADGSGLRHLLDTHDPDATLPVWRP